MTTDPHEGQTGPEFEQDLEAVRSAWAGLENSEPPDLLDQAVLNTARRQLAQQQKYRPLRWLGAFATAAVVVLALTLVIRQDEQSLAPGREKADGFMRDQAAPAPAKKELDRIEPEGKDPDMKDARPRAASQAVSNEAAAFSLAEEMAAAPPEQGSDEVAETEAWIRRLLQLRKTNQREELARELAAFREAHPNYALPHELRY